MYKGKENENTQRDIKTQQSKVQRKKTVITIAKVKKQQVTIKR